MQDNQQHYQYPVRMTIDGVKGWTDGTLGTRTAWLRQPYLNSDKSGGPWLEDLDSYRENIKKAAEAGYSILLHAIGDKAIGFNLSVFQECIQLGLGTAPLRIEYFQHPAREDIKAMQHPRLVASMQPLHMCGDAIPAGLVAKSKNIRRRSHFRIYLASGEGIRPCRPLWRVNC